MASKKDKSDYNPGVAVDIGTGSSHEVDAKPVPDTWLARVKAALQVEQKPGTFAPGRWSNAGE